MSDIETRTLHPERLSTPISHRPGRLDMRFTLLEAERKFRRACEQLVVLNAKIDGLQDRYNRAKADNARAFRYSLRLRLSVVEGMRNMYYDYAHWQAVQVTKLRTVIFVDQLPSSGYEDEDDDDVMDLV